MIAATRTYLPAALASVLVAVAIAGCGGGDKKEGPQIPRAEAAALINRLQEAERRSDPFRCNDLRDDTLPALEKQLKALPSNVDADVRSTVEDGIAHLRELVDQECKNQQTTTPTDTTPTTPDKTPTTPQNTTPAPTTPQNTTPTPTTPAPTPTTPTPTPETPGNGGAGAGNGKQKKPKDKVTE